MSPSVKYIIDILCSQANKSIFGRITTHILITLILHGGIMTHGGGIHMDGGDTAIIITLLTIIITTITELGRRVEEQDLSEALEAGDLGEGEVGDF